MYSDIFGKEVPLHKNLTQEQLAALFVIRCSSIKEFMARNKNNWWNNLVDTPNVIETIQYY